MPDSLDRPPARGFHVRRPRVFFAESKGGQDLRSGPQGSPPSRFDTFKGVTDGEMKTQRMRCSGKKEPSDFTHWRLPLVLLTDIPEAKAARHIPHYPVVPAIRLGGLDVASAFQG